MTGLKRGRKPKPILHRIQKFLDVNIMVEEIPAHIRDQHWLWGGKLPPPQPKRRYNKLRSGFETTEKFVMPARIRDTDGKMRSVIRILHRELRGSDYPYLARRSHGCDYRCVNPYHLPLPPDSGPDIEPPPPDVTEDLEGLIEEIENFIAAHGADEDAIRDRFLLDYTEEEIKLALEKVNA